VSTTEAKPRRSFWDMTRYQWLVLGAAWLGWGFDVFDGLLFNYVAPTCVPTLLDITPLDSQEAKAATLQWTGYLTSLLLIGWGLGGIIFGRVADKIGRTKTLLLTILMYALGTALCSVAPNIWALMLFRIIASLGIGGEWAAGAAMVAEVVPEKRRVEAGALLYTSAPAGLFLATFVTKFIQGDTFNLAPEVAWRYVFLTGLVPALFAFMVRIFVKEPERWKGVADKTHVRISELFKPEYIRITLSGLAMAAIALITWWTCNAFIATVATGLAQAHSKTEGLTKEATAVLVGSWKAIATNWFNLGGLLGTLLTIPVAKYLGRRAMFVIYFVGAAAAITAAFGLPMPEQSRLIMYFFIGLTVFGIFGSFTFYLPELFPTRLRGTGAGFCYNAGRFIAAGGPFLIGSVAARKEDALGAAMQVLTYVGLVPLLGLLLMPLVIETKGRELVD
jgi:MFS family permease